MKSHMRCSVLFFSLGLFIAGCGSDAPESAPSATNAIELAPTEIESAPSADPTSEPATTESEPKGPMRVGVFAGSVPPLTITDGDTYSGFEIDIASEIIARLRGADAQIEWVPIEAPDRFSSLATGRIDMLVRATLHTVSREEQALFSGGYLLSGNSFLVFQDAGFSSVADLDGKDIGVLPFMVDRLIEVADAHGYTFNARVFEELTSALGRAHAIFDDWVFLIGFMDPAVQALIVDGSFLGPIGIAFPLGEEDFRDEVNVILSEMIADGTWQSLFDKWFGIEVPWNVEEMFAWPAVDQ